MLLRCPGCTCTCTCMVNHAHSSQGAAAGCGTKQPVTGCKLLRAVSHAPSPCLPSRALAQASRAARTRRCSWRCQQSWASCVAWSSSSTSPATATSASAGGGSHVDTHRHLVWWRFFVCASSDGKRRLQALHCWTLLPASLLSSCAGVPQLEACQHVSTSARRWFVERSPSRAKYAPKSSPAAGSWTQWR